MRKTESSKRRYNKGNSFIRIRSRIRWPPYKMCVFPTTVKWNYKLRMNQRKTQRNQVGTVFSAFIYNIYIEIVSIFSVFYNLPLWSIVSFALLCFAFLIVQISFELLQSIKSVDSLISHAWCSLLVLLPCFRDCWKMLEKFKCFPMLSSVCLSSGCAVLVFSLLFEFVWFESVFT